MVGRERTIKERKDCEERWPVYLWGLSSVFATFPEGGLKSLEAEKAEKMEEHQALKDSIGRRLWHGWMIWIEKKKKIPSSWVRRWCFFQRWQRPETFLASEGHRWWIPRGFRSSNELEDWIDWEREGRWAQGERKQCHGNKEPMSRLFHRLWER